jgi:hypothetical protein
MAKIVDHGSVTLELSRAEYTALKEFIDCTSHEQRTNLLMNGSANLDNGTANAYAMAVASIYNAL